MELFTFLVALFVSGVALAVVLGIELKPILTRLDKIIHLLEKK